MREASEGEEMIDDKMTIEKARKIASFPWNEKRCYCETLYCEHPQAKGFIDGWNSRQAEIDELKKEIECLRDKSGVGSDEFIRASKKLGWPKEKTDERRT